MLRSFHAIFFPPAPFFLVFYNEGKNRYVLGVCVVVLKVKLPLGMEIRLEGYLQLFAAPDPVSWEAVDYGPSTWVAASHGGNLDGWLGFGK